MSIGILPNGNINQVIDYSVSLQNIPNQWGLYNALGIFQDEPMTQPKIGIPIWDATLSVAVDKNWDERNPTLKRNTRRLLNVDIPHFPADDSIVPNDVRGIISFADWTKGDAITLETVQRLRGEKQARAKQTLDTTLEVARAQLIRDGSVYAPSGTLKQSYGTTINFYNEFGITQTTISTPLAASAVDPSTYWEQLISTIQDNVLTGSAIGDIVVVCSPTYFTALITNDFYVDNAKQNQVIGSARLEKRLTANGFNLDARYRSIEINGITFIEYRGTSPTGTAYIPAGEARAFPLGVVDMFKTYYAPASRFETNNKVAQKYYAWEWVEFGKNQEITFQNESNFLNAVLRPQAIIRLTLA